MKIRKRFQLSPAMAVACLALFVSLGGGAYAALHLKKNSVTTSSIKNGAVTSSKIANHAITGRKLASGIKVASASTADNALKLGGQSPSSYQSACKAGAIKASLVINTSAITSTTYTDVGGFNCTGGAVQVRRTATLGTYQVKFVGSDSGSAVASAGETVTGGGILPGDAIVVQAQKATGTDDGEFTIEVRDESSVATNGSTFTSSGQLISVLAF